MKYDEGKPPISLVPPECIEEIAKCFGYGAEKYGPYNWRHDVDKTSYSRTYSSIQRHLGAYWRGEDLDPESGLSHLSHAATQIFILMIQNQEGPQQDDRFSHEEAKLNRAENALKTLKRNLDAVNVNGNDAAKRRSEALEQLSCGNYIEDTP